MSNYINTLSKYKISDGWNDHLARGSGGGIDYAVGEGTPIPAPCNGRVENIPHFSGYGNYIRFYHDADTVGVGAGWRDEYLHLKDGGFVAPGQYRQGETIGYSGSTGYSTGPHIHHHLFRPDGVRVNPLLYVDGGSGIDAQATNLQTLLNRFGYGLVVDGIIGPKTKAAVRDFQEKKGLVVDGIVGPKTLAALNAGTAPAPTPAPAPSGLAVDGSFGPKTIAALQRVLGVTADGVYGPVTKKALQNALGVTADGIVGPQTIRALQARVGAVQDGDWGPATTRALQARLNTGTL
jgi:peptidoglycan hydrolase-like protein with peptidoglycan-binding domain